MGRDNAVLHGGGVDHGIVIVQPGDRVAVLRTCIGRLVGRVAGHSYHLRRPASKGVGVFCGRGFGCVGVGRDNAVFHGGGIDHGIVVVLPRHGIGVQRKILCCDRRVAGDGDCAAACSNAAVHLQHRCALVITGLGRCRDRDRVAIGIGTGRNTGDGRAGARGHGDGVQRFKFRGDFDQVDIHLPGEAALLAAVMLAEERADKGIAFRRSDIFDFIGVFEIEIVIEIVDIVCDLDAVDIDIRGEEIDIIKLVFAVEHRIHIELLFDLFPVQMIGCFVLDFRYFAEALRHGQNISRCGAAVDDQNAFLHLMISVVFIIPVSAGVAVPGRVGRIKP